MKIPVVNILISHKPLRFPTIFAYSFQRGARNDIIAIVYIFLMKSLFLNGFFLTRKISSFMGNTNEAGAESTKMRIATLAQMAARRTPVETHQPKYKPRKITKTNKIGL